MNQPGNTTVVMVVKCWWYLAVWGPGGRHRSTPIAHNITFINNNIFIRWRCLVYGQIMNIVVHSYCYEKRTADLSGGGKERRDSKQLIIVAPPSPPSNTHPADRQTSCCRAAPRRSRPVLHASSALLVGGEGRWHPAGRGDGRLTDPSVPASLPPAGPPPPTTATERRRLCEGGTIRNLQHDLDHASRLPLTIIT